MLHPTMDWESLMSNVRRLQEAQAVAQHHDAVAGTEKQHVADDYAKRLSIGSQRTAYAANVLLNALSAVQDVTTPGVYHLCPLSNVSVCPSTATLSPVNAVVVSVHNSLAVERDEHVFVPVPSGRYSVRTASGESVPVSVMPAFHPGTTSPTHPSDVVLPLRLWFRARVPPLGVATYVIHMEGPLTHEPGYVYFVLFF
jgi:Alpha mannosidase middle domain